MDDKTRERWLEGEFRRAEDENLDERRRLEKEFKVHQEKAKGLERQLALKEKLMNLHARLDQVETEIVNVTILVKRLDDDLVHTGRAEAGIRFIEDKLLPPLTKDRANFADFGAEALREAGKHQLSILALEKDRLTPLLKRKKERLSSLKSEQADLVKKIQESENGTF